MDITYHAIVEQNKGKEFPRAGYSAREKIRDAAIILSLVNIAYLRVWTELLALTPADQYWDSWAPGRVDYLAAVLGCVGIAAALFAMVLLVRLKLRGWAQRLPYFVFLILSLISGLVLRDVLVAHYPDTFDFLREPFLYALSRRVLHAVFVTVCMALLLALIRYHRPVIRLLGVAFLMVSPFVPMTLGRALWLAFTASPHSAAPTVTAPYLAAAPGAPRVVWIIFDEWDYRLTFSGRKPGLAMPAIDRLAGESFFAENAFAPTFRTFLSMSSFLDGSLVAEFTPVSATQAMVYYSGRRAPALWGSQPNLFSKAREAGFNSAVVAWYIPYCKAFGPVLSSCYWMPMASQANTTGNGLLAKTVNQARSILETRTVSFFGQSLPTKFKETRYNLLMEHVRAAVRDPRLGLTLIHLPVPHSPHAYNRLTGKFDLANRPIAGYIDSLALLDRTVADLRNAMERAGQWDRTVLLLSADHPFRSSRSLDGKSDSRVPFLLKFAGQRNRVAYDRCFNTILTSDLLLKILKGELTNPDQMRAWLDRQPVRCGPLQLNSSGE